MVEDSLQAHLHHTPKRRLGQTAEIEHMTIENPKSAPDIAAQLIANGYQPAPIPHGQKGPRIPGWQDRTFKPTDFAADANIGIRCGDGAVAFCDIDVYCPETAKAIAAEWLRRFPAQHCNCMQRTGQPPKTGFLFRLPHPIAKITQKIAPTGYAPEGKDDGIEILCEGQQVVAFGIHPDTQKPYQWHGFDPTDFMGKVDDLPEITRERIVEFLEWVCDAYGPQKLLSVKAAAAIQPPAAHTGPVIDLGSYCASYTSSGPTEAEARDLLDYLDPDMPYDDWLSVLMGLHAAGDHMLPLAIEWSSGGSKFRQGEIEHKWRGFTRGSGVGWATIPAMARDCGARLGEIGKKHDGVDAPIPQNSAIVPSAIYAERVSAAAEQINNFKSGIFRACDLDGQPVPERVWHVHDLIPANTVTLLSGDGGTGKSLCALQLAVSTALQRPWLGLAVRHGKAVYLSAEDDKAELHRRLADITRAENATLADLGDLTLRSLAGEDALLAIVAKGGTLQATPLLEAVEQLLQHDCPDLLVLDTLADYFPGDENNRAQARQFIGLLRGLAINHRCAVVMLAHPSLHGIASGTGTSGSTGWNNSVRSRLYLSRILDKGYEQNPDARVLSVMKSNYSGIGREIALTWQNGVFVADAPVTGLDRMAAIAKAERVFLSLLRLFTEQGRNVNHAGGPNYAPSLFAEHPEREGMTKRVLKTAMDSLLRAGKIRIVKSGPPSKPRTHLEVAE